MDSLDSGQLEIVKSRRPEWIVSTYHLLGNHDNCLDGKLPVAVIEKILQAGAEKVNNEDVVETFLTKVIDIRDPGYWMSVMRIAGRQRGCRTW